MRDRKQLAIVGLLALVLIAAPGCVSSKMFKRNVGDTDGRIAAVEDAVEGQGEELSSLKADTRSKIDAVQGDADAAAALGNKALDAAAMAEKAAQGKLLWSVTLSDDKVKFDFGGSELTADARGMLDELVGKVKSYGKQLYIEVEGHTDNIGAEEFNIALSEERALAVRNYLNQNGGIPLHAMNTIALGEADPVADNGSKEGRASNRRVVIRVLE